MRYRKTARRLCLQDPVLHLSKSSLGRAGRTIGDYHYSLGGMFERLSVRGNQPGNPKLGAKAIVDVIHSEKVPLRLALGADAYERISKQLVSMRQNLEEWEPATKSTSLPG